MKQSLLGRIVTIVTTSSLFWGVVGCLVVGGMVARFVALNAGGPTPFMIAEPEPEPAPANAAAAKVAAPPKKRLGFATPDPQTVALTMSDVTAPQTPKSVSHAEFQGALVRELARQAVLISARDEIHATTRDAALGDTLGTIEDNPAAYPLEVEISVLPSGAVDVELVQPQLGKPPLTRHMTTTPLPDDRLYEAFSEQLEGFSRTSITEFLREAGYTGNPPDGADDDSIPEDIESTLGNFDELSQLAGIRALHKLLRNEGETPRRLEALVLAYANLGSLTEPHWQMHSKVFKARAILYAHRLVAKTGGSLSALAHRAYAWTLVGRQATALRDLDLIADGMKAGRLQGDLPPWVATIRAFCEYRPQDLEEAPESQQILATYFLLILTDPRLSEQQVMALGQKRLEQSPACMRTIHFLQETYGLSVQRSLGEKIIPLVLPQLYDAMLHVPDLTDEIREIAEEQSSDGEVKDNERSMRVKFVALLKEHEDRESDIRLTAFANLLQEFSLLHANRTLTLLRDTLGSPTEEWAASFEPFLEGHKFVAFPKTFDSDRLKRGEALDRLKESMTPYDLGPQCAPLLKQFSMHAFHQDFVKQAERHADAILSDLIPATWDTRPNPPAERIGARLLGAAPHMPQTVSYLLDWQFEKYRAQAAAWEAKYSDNVLVLYSLTDQYTQAKLWPEAERTAQRRVEIMPEIAASQVLAKIYKSQGKTDEWREALVQGLEAPQTGLSHAEVQVELAHYHMQRKEFALAMPYADAAAQTNAAWALTCAIECGESLGDLEATEKYVKSLSHRYIESIFDWYLWCVRTGHGDVEEAKKLAVLRLEQLPKELPERASTNVILCRLIDNETDLVIRYYEREFARFQHDFDGLFLALLVDAEGNAQRRDDLLKGMAARSQGDTIYPDLASMFLRYDEAGTSAKWNDLTFNHILAGASRYEATNLYFLTGRFLTSRGEREHGHEYLKFAVSSPLRNNQARTLAAMALHAEKQAIPTQRDVVHAGAAAVLLPYAGIRPYTANKLWQRLLDLTSEALTKNPQSTALLLHHANAAEGLGRDDVSRTDLRKALEINPELEEAQRKLADLLATSSNTRVRDGKQALVHARLAHSLRMVPNRLNEETLAVAFAACGDFGQAAKHQEEVIKLWPNMFKTEPQQRLELYQAKQPFIRPAATGK